MIYGCLQPRELWLIDFNHVQCTRFLCEDMAYEGVLQRPALLLAQFVERPALGGCEEVRLQFSGVDQHSITLEPHLLQQVKLRGRRGDYMYNSEEGVTLIYREKNKLTARKGLT